MFKEHLLALEEFFPTLRKFRLKFNPEKCTFLPLEAKNLGRSVCSRGFKVDPEYISAIREMEPLISKKALQSLISCLVWIRQFLETCLDKQIRSDTFSNLTRSIHKLNKANKAFIWTEKADKAFQKITDYPHRKSSPNCSQFFTYHQYYKKYLSNDTVIHSQTNISFICLFLWQIFYKREMNIWVAIVKVMKCCVCVQFENSSFQRFQLKEKKNKIK